MATHPSNRTRALGRWFVIGVCVGLMALGVFLFKSWCTAPAPSISQMSYNEIRTGASLEEVIRIIGGPPGDYTDGNYTADQNIPAEFLESTIIVETGPAPDTIDSLEANNKWKVWIGDEVSIWINLNSSGKVTQKAISGVTRVRKTILSKLRRLFHVREMEKGKTKKKRGRGSKVSRVQVTCATCFASTSPVTAAGLADRGRGGPTSW